MLFEIVLYVKQRMAGRVSVDDGEIVSVVENGVKREPKSKSYTAAIQHLMNETDLEPVGEVQQIGKKSHFTTYKYTYRKPGVYVNSQHDKWAVAYEKNGFWWVHRLGRDTDTCFRTQDTAMADVDSWVGYDYLKDLRMKTVDKDHKTQREMKGY